jgi:hypothetical protein
MLLDRQRQQHPNQSDHWYLEKVIHDLERNAIENKNRGALLLRPY